MATGTGLDAQLMVGQESVWGTLVTPDHALEFNDESLKLDPTFLEPTGLRVGTKFKRASRVSISRKSVSGDVTLEHATRNMGLLWKHALASSAVPTQISSSTAYEQIHVPGDHRGLGLTIQVGRPEPSTGTVRPFTFAGCKVTAWEFSLSDNAIPTLKLTFDGRSEDTATALAAPAYVSGSAVFSFASATLKLGGTATTASGKTTVASNTAVATIINEITIAGAVPVAADRYGIGNSGLKAEQLENDTPTITGSLGAEFGKTELYDVFSSNTTKALVLALTGADAGGGNLETLEFVLPAVKFKQAAPNVGGPDVVSMSTDFEAYSDEVNPAIQVRIVSKDTTL
ncbi:phage tail tube protein [Streptomyces cylindrosporus]|uniref:Phage tail tube protein n=1 Tax=Streptomyces cylindrosporus TaxID=2927583 RepID=A0ABS9YJU5_9ACTN|nr:phage tail tube protein [Streptomyces cylindrosporus]MCI3277527.1 phage tail tube protein [Streptomyces cylindrosporus]